MKYSKKIHAIVTLTIIITNIFCVIGLNYLFDSESSSKSQKIQQVPLSHLQNCGLFDGMYINHTLTLDMGGPPIIGDSSFSYSQLSANASHVRWDNIVFGLAEWDVDIRNRVMDNSSGVILLGDGNHDPSWIFTNVTLGTLVQIANIMMVDGTFNVSGELVHDLPGHGPVDVWVLEEIGATSSVLWYEKNYGILLNGSFDLGFGMGYSFDFTDTNIFFGLNDYTPSLTMGNVTPLTGDQVTEFNFSVVYTDQDNNTAYFVNVLINNTPYTMAKQNPSDINYTDGCIYQFLTYLQPGDYNYSFECFDGKYSNSTGTYFGLSVSNVTNTNAPVLYDGQVTPAVGHNSSTIFRFQVNYTDIDNYSPTYVNVTINSTTNSMIKLNPADMNYVDGCLFIYDTTLNTIATYSYYFNCSDGDYNASLGPISGPIVQKTQIFDGMYVNHTITSTALGNGPSVFLYSHFAGSIFNVTWVNWFHTWDVDLKDRVMSNIVGGWFAIGSHTPAWIFNTVSLGDSVQIASIIESGHIFNVSAEIDYLLPGFGPIEVWVLEDLTTPGGIAWYEKSTGILLNGTFYFAGGAWDYTFDFNDTNVAFTYITNDYAPELTSGSVVPLNGNQTTLFNFSVTYTDADNNYPLYIDVLINGTPYPMAKQNSSDNNYTDGCVYQYLTYLQPGLYNFSFECGDWNFTNSTVTYFGLNVSGTINLNAPTLDNGEVNPAVGHNSSTLFTFRVNYTDLDNNPPAYVNVTINATVYSMTQQYLNDTSYQDGCWYNYSTILTNLGTHSYYFNCSDGNYTASHGPLTGPVVTKTQLFDGMYINHTLTSAILGNGPSVYLYSSFGGGIFNVTWVNWFHTWDVDVRNRVMSNVVGGLFASGSHSPAWILNTVSLGDSVQIASIMEPDHIHNVSGELTYYHPKFGSLDVWVLEDLTAPGGIAWYEKSSGILLNGTFYFMGLWSYTMDFVDTNAIPNDYAPELTSGSVVPLSGNQTTPFNFSVTYTDQDNNPPIYLNVLINGTPYPMAKQNPSDINYTDGCLYEYPTYLQPGLYNYSFECSDWKFPNSTSTYTGINVTQLNANPPTLSNGQVNPPTGWSNSTQFVFTVNYTETENNAPIYVNVTINGTIYSMIKQNPLDMNYMDGCIYEYSTTLNIGTYNYTFNCSDGVFPDGDGPYFGLVVEQNILKNYIMVPDYRYEWVDATTGIRASMDGMVDEAQLFNLPFQFRFYNETYDSIYVCTNGFVSFTYETSWMNVPFPSSSYPNMIAPFWDDLQAAIPCNIFVRNLTSPNRVAIEWENVNLFMGPILGTFEIVLFESGDIVFNYDYLNDASSYTCGLNYGINTSFFNAFTALNTSMDDFSILFYQDDLIPPNGTQSPSTNISNPQNGDVNGFIWVNGTAWDNIRVQNVTVEWTNHTGNPWSANLGSNTNWAFNNISTINDGYWEVWVNVTDLSGNSAIINCSILVDSSPPYGSQSPSTNLSNPQRGDANQFIWVNGTAGDDGIGVASVTIHNTTHPGNPWSTNLGTNQNWAFNNISTIQEGQWEIQVNVTDYTNNSVIIVCNIFVDTVAPTGSQWVNTTTPEIQRTSTLWINGTYNDPSPSSGIQLIIVSSNTSGGVADWSVNVGSGQNFAFYNVSPLADNSLNGFYEINITLFDNAGNQFDLTCRVTVEINPPYGSQSSSTNASNPQRGDVNSYIWVNGTTGDDGFGVASVTLHNTTHPGTPWSTNLGTNQNWAFNNISTIQEGQWEIQVNVTDYANNSLIIICQIYVDTVAPTGSQWVNITTPEIQRTSTLWINGTYTDPSPSSGIQSLIIVSSNTSGGVADWSTNIGSGQNFAFYNVSPLADNSLGSFYEINITILDNAGNQFGLTCRITVEINPPSGSQDATTQVPTRGDANGRVWVNGTCSDLGFGMKNVTIQWSNHSGWSSNQGTLNSWAFYNTSSIGGGLWEVQINVTDLANNSAIIICYVYVDYVAPTGSQTPSTNVSSPQNGDPNGFIWVNGTASDGPGVGMLNVTIVATNHTGNPWSPNQGTNESWSFRNTSTIIDGVWNITVMLTDLLGNARNITCYIFVDTVAPTGLQDLLTQAFQTTDQNGLVWINGTASDVNGSGILDIVVAGWNGTGNPWSSNQNTTEYWAFSNTSAISDGSWMINITITDRASNSINITAYIMIDTAPPSGAQDLATQQPQNAGNGYVWINGTASDGSGVGIFEVSVLTSNHTPANVWSLNLGTNQSWSFNNISTINDGSWLVVINVTDKVGNSQFIFAFVTVDTTAPQGSQDARTVLPQKSDQNGRIWVNGTATDGNGTGISSVSIVWTNGTATWSVNTGNNTNWAFYNTTPVPDGAWEIRISLVDAVSNSRNITCVIFVDNTAPAGTQNPLTNSSYYQETVQIWVNGTASDVNSSGILSVSVVIGMGTAPNTWSSNQGTNASWAFTNASAIPTDQSYWIMVNITDKVGNEFLLNCTFRVELNPPQGAQDPITALPQNGDAQGYIWINGTAFDGGSGVKNVSITYTNSSATFSNNLGDNSTWTFRNSSAILDGVWSVTITIFDIAGHSTNVSGILIVDTTAPTQPTNGSYTNPTASSVLLTWNAVTDNTTVTYYIYRNGTSIGNTTLLSYLDSGLSPGTYIYYIIPVDAAGNAGPASANITVIISGVTPPGDNTIIIIIIIVAIGAVAIGVITVQRRKKRPRPRPRPSIRLEPTRATIAPKESKTPLEAALKEKAEEAPKKLPFFMIDEGKPAKEPEITIEVEEEAVKARKEVIEAKKEAKPEISKERVLPKVVHFTFYCLTCKKWFGLQEYAKIDCPICKNPLKLSYACPNCKNRFTMKEPGVYNCPRCKTTKLVP
ncbi:MAG: hypothetical protein HWN65_05315 [Candidatus Helarchaeota archaeon]|nr:hypothetical protein [Candidatus Helarchaeota archaeon]